jgi:hypothetical protein
MRSRERVGAAKGLPRASSLGTLLAAAFVPKCPLCVAAMLSALGVGTASASVLAPVVRPAVFTLAAAALVVLAWTEWRRLRAKRRAAASVPSQNSAHFETVQLGSQISPFEFLCEPRTRHTSGGSCCGMRG